jgi:hypothetical protein
MGDEAARGGKYSDLRLAASPPVGPSGADADDFLRGLSGSQWDFLLAGVLIFFVLNGLLAR